MPEFEWTHLLDSRGRETGCWRWTYNGVGMCDHEHGEFDTICEDARIMMSWVKMKQGF